MSRRYSGARLPATGRNAGSARNAADVVRVRVAAPRHDDRLGREVGEEGAEALRRGVESGQAGRGCCAVGQAEGVRPLAVAQNADRLADFGLANPGEACGRKRRRARVRRSPVRHDDDVCLDVLPGEKREQAAAGERLVVRVRREHDRPADPSRGRCGRTASVTWYAPQKWTPSDSA